MRKLSLYQLVSILFALFVGLLLASGLDAWVGPTSTPPQGNVAAPINVGTASQIKDGTIGVDGLAVFGAAYIQSKLGVGVLSPVVSIETPGTLKIGSGGEVCQSVTEGALRYKSETKRVEYCDGTSWREFANTIDVTNITESIAANIGEPVAYGWVSSNRGSTLAGSGHNVGKPSWVSVWNKVRVSFATPLPDANYSVFALGRANAVLLPVTAKTSQYFEVQSGGDLPVFAVYDL